MAVRGLAPDAGGDVAGGEPAAPPGPAKSAGSGSFSAAARARTAADVAGEAGGVAAGGELAGPPGPARSAGSGNVSAAARARTAADFAGLESKTADSAELAAFPGCEGFSAGAAGGEEPVAAGPTRVPGRGARAGKPPGAGTLDPAWPSPCGGFGGGPGDIQQETRIHEDPVLRYAHPFRDFPLARTTCFPASARRPQADSRNHSTADRTACCPACRRARRTGTSVSAATQGAPRSIRSWWGQSP